MLHLSSKLNKFAIKGQAHLLLLFFCQICPLGLKAEDNKSLLEHGQEVVVNSANQLTRDYYLQSLVSTHVIFTKNEIARATIEESLSATSRTEIKKQLREFRKSILPIDFKLGLKSIFGNIKQPENNDNVIYDLVILDVKQKQQGLAQASLNSDINTAGKNDVVWGIEAVEKSKLSRLNKTQTRDLDIEFKAGLKDGEPKFSFGDNYQFYKIETSANAVSHRIGINLTDKTRLQLQHSSNAEDRSIVVNNLIYSQGVSLDLSYSPELDATSADLSYEGNVGAYGVDIYSDKNTNGGVGFNFYIGCEI